MSHPSFPVFSNASASAIVPKADATSMRMSRFFKASRRDWITRAALVASGCCVGKSSNGQFPNAPVGDGGPTLGDVREQRFRVGVVVTAAVGPCRNIYATMPVPAEWPEQRVQVVSETVSPGVRGPKYRELSGGVRQMIVDIPDMAAGERLEATVTFALQRSAILPPEQTDRLRIPEKVPREMRTFLGPSPYIETRHQRIVKLAEQATEGVDGWNRVESIYDAVREAVEYRNGPLKGAARALADGWGDCEELTCLFIAACRSQQIPSRTVWVEGHCYPEFYLENQDGEGWWFPCQAAGARSFGGMPDQLPIIQKGDSFRDPDRPGKVLRYVSEFVKGSSAGGGQPDVDFVREGA